MGPYYKYIYIYIYKPFSQLNGHNCVHAPSDPNLIKKHHQSMIFSICDMIWTISISVYTEITVFTGWFERTIKPAHAFLKTHDYSLNRSIRSMFQ